MNFSDYLAVYKKHEKPPSTLFHKLVSKNGAKVFSYICIKLGVTPNQISLFSLLLLCAGSFIVAYESDNGCMLWVAAILLQISYICDCSDGVVARYSGLSSKFGAYLDVLLDRIGGLIFSIAVGYYALIIEGVLYPKLFLFALIIYYFFQISSTLRPYYFPELSGKMKNSKKPKSILMFAVKFIYEFIDTGIYFFLVSLSIIFGVVGPVIYVYGMIATMLFFANLFVLYRHKEQ